MANDPDTKYARFAITPDVLEILDRESKELQKAAWEAHSCQDDSIPFIASAQAELEERQNSVLRNRFVAAQTLKEQAEQLTKSISDTKAKNEQSSESTSSFNPWNEPCKYTVPFPTEKSKKQEKEWELEQLELQQQFASKENGSPPKSTVTIQPTAQKASNEKTTNDKQPSDSEDFFYIYQG